MSLTTQPIQQAPREKADARPVATPSLFDPIAAELRAVEERLAAETRSEVGAVRDISGHTLLAGGKRLRPALAILCARVVGRAFPTERVLAAAAAAEMIHMATLMHDDVVDDADERRGRPTASAVFGNGITVLTGDYLLAKSISMLAHSDDNLHIVRVFSDVTVAMAEGEVLQAALAHDLDITAERYEEVIDRKTARFLAGCTETGSMLGGADPAQRAALRAYGYQLGIAFQIADDLLDLNGDPARTGKPLGTDLRDGRITLPLIHTLDRAAPDERRLLHDTLRRSEIGDSDIAAIAGLIESHGGFDAARRIAEERAELAISHLSAFPATSYRDTLERLARFVVGRDR